MHLSTKSVAMNIFGYFAFCNNFFILFSVLWEDTLRDNLLNYAGTPKGVLLLQQTGALKDGVSYMFSRYIRKLQVGLLFFTLAELSTNVCKYLNTLRSTVVLYFDA